jgi:hypothetical protein
MLRKLELLLPACIHTYRIFKIPLERITILNSYCEFQGTCVVQQPGMLLCTNACKACSPWGPQLQPTPQHSAVATNPARVVGAATLTWPWALSCPMPGELPAELALLWPPLPHIVTGYMSQDFNTHVNSLLAPAYADDKETLGVYDVSSASLK